MSSESTQDGKPKQSQWFTISTVDHLIGFAEVEKLITEHGLDMKSPKVQIVGKTENSVGTDNAKASNIMRYEQIYPGFLDSVFLLETTILPCLLLVHFAQKIRHRSKSPRQFSTYAFVASKVGRL